MKQPAMHAKLRPGTTDCWDPYKERQYVGHLLGDDYFNVVNSDWSQDPEIDYMGHGCLDAPDEIPCGSTLCVTTVGGWQREAYNRQWRECDDWKAAARAEVETAEMIRGLPAEIDAEERRVSA